jgi:hypothetical protein
MKQLAPVAFLALLASTNLLGQEASPTSPVLLKANFGKLPIYFVENKGVYPEEVAYYIQGGDKTLFFTRDGITLRLKGRDRDWVVKLEFVGASRDVVPRGEDRQQAVFSYFRGPEKDWKTGLRSYSKIIYRNLWPGIDLVYHGEVNHVKYEFLVAPGADPARIQLRYQGVDRVLVERGGSLRVTTPAGALGDAAPIAWQAIDGRKVLVDVAFRLDAQADACGRLVGFRIGDRDPSRRLTIDPAVLVYCGFIGGTTDDIGQDVAVDAQGNAYVVGMTQSDQATFPVKVGPDLTYNDVISGSYGDAFVAKVNPAGNGLVYCGFIGGTGVETALGVAVDAGGSAYVTGSTGSPEATFPVKVGPDLTYNGGLDAFIAKVNPLGTGLTYCGYIGGALDDTGSGVAVDPGGNAYVAGSTVSDQSTFPVLVGPDLTYNGSYSDGFVAKVTGSGSTLSYCGYIGGQDADYCADVAVDANGNAYVVGSAQSSEATFPVRVGPDLTKNSPWFSLYDAFVAKVNGSGSGLVYCGYIGGFQDDFGYGIDIDEATNAYVCGRTSSDQVTFPVRTGPDLTLNSSYDGFVAKVNVPGTALVYCGYIGGAGGDGAAKIAVDSSLCAHVVGVTTSDEKTFPVGGGPDLTFNGIQDVFVTKVNPQGTALDYCGYIGGSGGDTAGGIDVDSAGNAFVAGTTPTTETTFPVLVGPDLTHNGRNDAFVAEIAHNGLGGGTTSPRIGTTVTLTLVATADGGLAYQVGSSLGTGPINLGGRALGLSPDDLLRLSVQGALHTVFVGYSGRLDATGRATASIHIPPSMALVGLRVHTAFVTLSASSPLGIRTISSTWSIMIAP